MVTFIAILSLLGFYLLYNTSQRVELSRSLFIERWAQDKPFVAQLSALSLFIVALLVSMIYFGVGSGAFLFFVVLMTVASLVILITPLKYLTYKSVAILSVFSFAIELILK